MEPSGYKMEVNGQPKSWKVSAYIDLQREHYPIYNFHQVGQFVLHNEHPRPLAMQSPKSASFMQPG